jgi:hypothetical protein
MNFCIADYDIKFSVFLVPCNFITWMTGFYERIRLYGMSRYRDWIRAGRKRGRCSSPGKGNIFLLSTSSVPVLGLTASGGKTTGE